MQNTFNQNNAEGNFQNNLFPQHFTKTHIVTCKSLSKIKAGLHPQCGEIKATSISGQSCRFYLYYKHSKTIFIKRPE